MQANRTETAAQAARLFGMGKFRLTGLFLVIAGLTFLGVAAAINFSTSRSEEKRIIASTTETAVKEAMGIAEIVSRLLRDGGNSSAALTQRTLSRSPFDIGEILSESNIVRLNLYAPNGDFIWSSTYERSAVDMHQMPIFARATDGTIASGLLRGQLVSPPGAAKYRADVVETFIPFADATSGSPAIVLGVTSDVTTELAASIGQTRSAIFRTTMISLGLGFAVLLATVLIVDVRLWKHRVKAIVHERQLASQELTSTRLDLVNRELQQINEERTKFISTVSHELKTPLTSIIAFTDILSRSQDGSKKERNLGHLEIVKKSGHHLLTLINDLLDYSRLESGEVSIDRETFEVGEVVGEVRSAMSPLLASKRQSFVFDGNLNGQSVRLDRRRLMQVLMNLVSNAHKYSPPGTTITVSGNIDRQNVRFSVADQGVGISVDDQVRLFTKFFRVDNEATRAVGGTGLGLSITKSIVEAHGGAINVRSQIGHGTQFNVTIPTGMPEPAAIGAREVASSARASIKSHLRLPVTRRAMNAGDQLSESA
ncbi:MAG: HAMP domain-containing sensor histidine kinase [Chloroflexi bacterium]|nr:HAMP domain-containing sensor histidine kinase [Chloroflexota bacterium]